ncbi:acid resistance serine protease MarP [Rhodococcus sp. ABRD24]|uniref:acid resistance serine protease MarP n=1 Tax=Rhodococcus sp. ABRD24 TaxID=2507582 RepID=UPI00103FBCBB|nr:acid resistance serine protease MarP [Rhodococcus sp. ABRD24]QBJ96984.1 acid resistance serine protease MarP [Rhodococcus sp. ABRD24]
MTGSAWLDVAVVLVALLAASSGWRHGAVASALAFLGVVLGAVAGILIAPHVLVHVDEGRMRVLAGVALIVVLVIVGEVAGMVLGRAARSGMHSPAARSVDSFVGAGLQLVAVLVAAWLLAIPLTTSTQVNVATAVRGSKVLSTVDDVAPDWLRRVPSEFSALLDTSGLPDVIGPFGRTPITDVSPPDGSVLASPIARQLQPSVLRIRGVAPSCQKALEGSGFVVEPERVMTNAHVVAGTSSVTVDTADGPLDARVVLFDPAVDIAVLDVPGLTAEPLRFAPKQARTGDNAIVLGYPGGGPYTASAARIREVLDLRGPDIYRSDTVEREVYTVRGSIRQGNSGGPLVDDRGQVLGVVFGAAVDDSDTGFVLTASEVSRQLDQAKQSSASVGTGVCIV